MRAGLTDREIRSRKFDENVVIERGADRPDAVCFYARFLSLLPVNVDKESSRLRRSVNAEWGRYFSE